MALEASSRNSHANASLKPARTESVEPVAGFNYDARKPNALRCEAGRDCDLQRYATTLSEVTKRSSCQRSIHAECEAQAV